MDDTHNKIFVHDLLPTTSPLLSFLSLISSPPSRFCSHPLLSPLPIAAAAIGHRVSGIDIHTRPYIHTARARTELLNKQPQEKTAPELLTLHCTILYCMALHNTTHTVPQRPTSGHLSVCRASGVCERIRAWEARVVSQSVSQSVELSQSSSLLVKQTSESANVRSGTAGGTASYQELGS